MSKEKFPLVPAPVVTTGLSAEEETRALTLADIALHNPIPPENNKVAGDRARADHQQLVKELQQKVDEPQNLERAA